MKEDKNGNMFRLIKCLMMAHYA